MKRCPECRRDYSDDTLLYCLEDGVALVQGSVPSPDEPQTAILHTTDAVGEAPTRAQIHTTEQTAVLPSGIADLPKRSFDKRLLAAACLLTTLVIGGFIGYRYFLSSSHGPINSIAVLPFENRSESADADYLSDGLAESLIFRLSQIPDLKVSPRSSVFRYKGQAADAEKVGRELAVDAVLSGRLVQRGENLSITVDLVDVRNKKTIWGEQFERKMSDLLATQREITAEIAQNLRLKLSGESEQKLAKKYTDNNEAYQLYLKGRFYWNKRTGESLKQAAEHYKQAVGKDPGFALAHSGLAETYVLFAYYDVASPRDSLPQGKTAAVRALELDDSLAEAHTALGWYLLQYEWNWIAAEREFRRAIEVNPNYATAHQWLAECLADNKRHDEAFAAARRAHELDPLSPIIGVTVGWTLHLARRYDEAISEYNRTLLLHPDFGVALAGLCWTYTAKGALSDAIASCRKAREIVNDAYNTGYLAMVLGRSGQREEARKLLDELRAESGRRYIQSYPVALAYLGLNEKEEAVAWLEKEVNERGYGAGLFAVTPDLDEFRSDPRFKELLKRMNLPE